MLSIYLSIIDAPQDKDKFILLYEKYHKLMHYTAKSILKNDALAEEAVQEAFIRIAKNFNKISNIDAASTKKFTVIITKNTALTIFKQEKKHDAENIEDYDTLNEKDTTIENCETNDLVKMVLELPGKQRDIMYLYAIYGYSYREISHLLGLKESTIRKNMQRAREKLKSNSIGIGEK